MAVIQYNWRKWKEWEWKNLTNAVPLIAKLLFISQSKITEGKRCIWHDVALLSRVKNTHKNVFFLLAFMRLSANISPSMSIFLFARTSLCLCSFHSGRSAVIFKQPASVAEFTRANWLFEGSMWRVNVELKVKFSLSCAFFVWCVVAGWEGKGWTCLLASLRACSIFWTFQTTIEGEKAVGGNRGLLLQGFSNKQMFHRALCC